MEAHCAQKSAVLSYSGYMAFLCFLFYLWVRSLDGQNVSCLFIMHLYLCVFWSTFMFRCPYNTYQRRRPLTEKNSRLLIFMQIADWMFVWGTEKSGNLPISFNSWYWVICSLSGCRAYEILSVLCIKQYGIYCWSQTTEIRDLLTDTIIC